MTLFTPVPSGASQCPTIWDANAPWEYGKSPVLICAPRYSSSVATTRNIPSNTSQAAPVCDPANRDSRPMRLGSVRSLMTVNVMMPASTATANRSSMNPMNAQWPMTGIANVGLNRSP